LCGHPAFVAALLCPIFPDELEAELDFVLAGLAKIDIAAFLEEMIIIVVQSFHNGAASSPFARPRQVDFFSRHALRDGETYKLAGKPQWIVDANRPIEVAEKDRTDSVTSVVVVIVTAARTDTETHCQGNHARCKGIRPLLKFLCHVVLI